MAAPKHLWSGDWQRESADRAPQPQSYVALARDSDGSSAATEAGAPPRWYRTRNGLSVLGGAVLLLVVVGVVLGLTLSGGSSRTATAQAGAQSAAPQSQTPNSGGQGLTPTTPQSQSTTPQQPTSPQAVSPVQTQPAQVNAGPTYDWLGMQINATSSGVTVGTVAASGAADSAGVNPGDVITTVNGTQVDSIAQLQSATRSLKLGEPFQFIVDRGSTPIMLTATLTGRPSRAS